VFPTEILRATTFRLASALAVLFGCTTILIFAFIYWQTAGSEARRIDALIIEDARIEAAEPGEMIRRFVTNRVTNDFHHLTYAGLFDSERQRIAGNLDAMPPDLPPDGAVHVIRIEPPVSDDAAVEAVRAVERRLEDGSYLVIARSSQELERLQEQVARALELGLFPAIILSLASGILLSWRAETRIKEVTDAAERIMRGQLRERLPVRGKRDDFDRLSSSVNRMLDEIERLLDEVKGTGDEIAHDLRTPLTRVRARLENARRKTASVAELQATIDKSMTGLDQALAIITALLRIREIEAGRRRAGFSLVDLVEVVSVIDELYQPIAEDKDIRLELRIEAVVSLRGDRDLLVEMVGNLVDNAIKFTPVGGAVTVTLADLSDRVTIRVADTGPGIAVDEREMVLLRSYRSVRSHHVAGGGLGLSLVAAIAQLHEIRLVFGDAAPGCVVDLLFDGAAVSAPPKKEPDQAEA
jgi:signal transduction histidine kinase